MSDFEQTECVQVMSKILRPLNFIGGVGAVTVGILVLLDQGANFRTTLNLIFTTMLGLLLLAGELNLTVINENCKFLATFIGRGFYNFFVGGWIYSLWSFFRGKPNVISELGDYLSVAVYAALWVLGGFFVAMHFFGKSKFIYEIQN